LFYFDRDWEGGGEAFRAALDINPNNAMARHGYADYLLTLGRLDESVEEVKRGQRSNPLSPLANTVVVGHLYIARRYDEAIAEAKRLLALDPGYVAVKGFLRRTLWSLGRYEEAIEMLRESGWARRPEYKDALDRGYAENGPKGAVLTLAQTLEARSDTEYVDPEEIARFYADAGELDSAMDWLEKAEEGRSMTLFHLLLDPCFDPIRDTPRFKALRQRLNLP
jgi:tetratricopeptide (TPR) repeat protein